MIGMTEANVRTQFGTEVYDLHRFIAHTYASMPSSGERKRIEAAKRLKLEACADVPASLKPGCEEYTTAINAWGTDSICSRTVNYHRIQCPARLTAKSQCIPADDHEYDIATGAPTTQAPTTDPTTDPTTSPSLSPTTPAPTTDPTTGPTSDPSLSPTTQPSLAPSFSPTTPVPTTDPTTVNPDQVTTVSIQFDLPTQAPTSTPTPVPTLESPQDLASGPEPEELMEISPQEQDALANRIAQTTTITTGTDIHYAFDICSEEGRLGLLAGIKSSLEEQGSIVTNTTIITITSCRMHVLTPAPTPMSYGEMLMNQGRPTPAPTAFELEDIIKLADQVGSRAEVHRVTDDSVLDLSTAAHLVHRVTDDSVLDQVGSRAEVQYTVISDSVDLATDVMHIVSNPSMNVALKENVPAMASEPATVELTAGFPPTPAPTQVPTAGPTIPQGAHSALSLYVANPMPSVMQQPHLPRPLSLLWLSSLLLPPLSHLGYLYPISEY